MSFKEGVTVYRTEYLNLCLERAYKWLRECEWDSMTGDAAIGHLLIELENLTGRMIKLESLVKTE